jgi:ArsR family transcriptional regulator, arsenate/arsenite/antimonite-responsive transcriptional repressor
VVEATHVDGWNEPEGLTLWRALADPTRLRVLALLAAGPRCVCALQAAVDVPANLLSHHLKVLRAAGLVEGTRRGRWIDYRLRPTGLDAAARHLAHLRASPPGAIAVRAEAVEA